MHVNYVPVLSFTCENLDCGWTWLHVFFRYKLGTNCDVLIEVVASANVLDCDESKEFASLPSEIWTLGPEKKFYLAKNAQTSTACLKVHSTRNVNS